MRYRYSHGDPNVICERSGFKVKKSQTRKQWDGLIVREEDWVPRHPQDYVRGRADRQSFPDPRPEAEDNFLTVNEASADNL